MKNDKSNAQDIVRLGPERKKNWNQHVSRRDVRNGEDPQGSRLAKSGEIVGRRYLKRIKSSKTQVQV